MFELLMFELLMVAMLLLKSVSAPLVEIEKVTLENRPSMSADTNQAVIFGLHSVKNNISFRNAR